DPDAPRRHPDLAAQPQLGLRTERWSRSSRDHPADSRSDRKAVMKSHFMSGALALAFAALLAVPVLKAEPKGPKHSPAHEAAVQKCTDAYEATAAAAHAPNSPTGKARMRTMHAAAEA